MAHLSIFAATLLLLLAVSNAAIYRTTIVTDEEGQNQGGQSQRCRQQIQSQQFQQCEQFIRQQSGGQRGQDEDVLLLPGGIQNQQEQTLRRCCQALRNMDQQCQCEGLRQIVERQQQGGQGQGQWGHRGQQGQQGQQEMMQIAQRLPERCGTGRACRNMEVVWF